MVFGPGADHHYRALGPAQAAADHRTDRAGLAVRTTLASGAQNQQFGPGRQADQHPLGDTAPQLGGDPAGRLVAEDLAQQASQAFPGGVLGAVGRLTGPAGVRRGELRIPAADNPQPGVPPPRLGRGPPQRHSRGPGATDADQDHRRADAVHACPFTLCAGSAPSQRRSR